MEKTTKSRPAKNKTEQTPAEKSSQDDDHAGFPILGIGASAGGLEALEVFLKGVPKNSGGAFVIVQHLDPKHKGLMPELLQRVTEMKVEQVCDRIKVKPNCVYVIPPNKDMSILRGVLHLFKPTEHHGLRLPIDLFLRSLADDCRERSIGVILSGMGSDGSLGLRAIKEKSGLVVVQEPATAKFDSMPRSAIVAGLADIIAPPEELPAKIFDYLQHSPGDDRPEPTRKDREPGALEKIVILLRSKTGHDFSLYKKNTLYRRIERRMGLHQIGKIVSYVLFLQQNPQEVELLFKELLIGVTNFFRDPAEWKLLEEEALPWLLADRSGGVIRAWVVGCSTGEEAYSLAIAFKETLEVLKPKASYSMQIFATDLDPDAIDKARQGFYPANISADVSAERLQRFFTQENNGYRISKEIRELVTFATQNVIMDPPFTKLDILICRNLLIYLEPEMQKRLLPLFHYSLRAKGILFLGSAESLNTCSDLFSALHPKSRLFRRKESVSQTDPFHFPTSFLPTLSDSSKELKMPEPGTNLQLLAEQLILKNYSSPAALVNGSGDILYINGRTGKYLEPAAGKANWNIFAMARDGLRFELNSSFQKAVREKVTMTTMGSVAAANGERQNVELTILPIDNPEALKGMFLIVFHDMLTPVTTGPPLLIKPNSDASVRIAGLEEELLQCREQLQASLEGMQSSQEELKSMNEELQSTNEELQSTNEELTTSQEELQSMNEELQTVNAEQNSKMNELTLINSDMKNLLNSTEIITLFLDNQLHIRRYTTGADKLFKLIPTDVGRPLTDISNELIFPTLAIEVQTVLQTLVFSEQQIATHDGRWFSIRIMPYRTLDNKIDGVVMTFTDITTAKKLEQELQTTESMLRSIVRATSSLIVCLSVEGQILEFNPEAEKLLGVTRKEALGQNFFAKFLSETERAEIKGNMEKLTTSSAENFVSQVRTASTKDLSIQWSVEKMLNPDKVATGFIIVGQNIDQ